MGKVKDPSLAEQGKTSYEWAKNHMKILTNTVNRLKRSQPLRGIRLGICLHITKETSVLIMGAKELGADVSACGANPLSTQDDIAAFLDEMELTFMLGKAKLQKNMIGALNKCLVINLKF